ncbi:hypothetical protein vBYenM636_83 [Yersinia phage vB_YenM_636]|nr:hypothetical protein X1_63 [Yersinia phage vB_Yen_X1]QKN86334.1 hypothetical protein vBYenM12_83 [Yersinia phage vB_YenM_12]QKN86425.1 hypothetical protein vBYenM22_83 [Yersinia phage vB_YenM_22]QKN86516.1 hypothetical protein vBYenM25_83 [Yersinia phage vB_YenM_25]QKN86607.1 hypothetical protein vBYenM27_83 [Yersinia phage vB_YenM_27]QKN86698.1 hypothetical protein vBYenM39_83 [Yersinia phage vB_YenM_39]QKN86789.1 hypothetical protein vBYenM126_83 [Yersinia phage vB_YenM_126]QKN86880.1 h
MLSNIAMKKVTDFINELLIDEEAASQYDQNVFNSVFESLIDESIEECEEDDLVKACLHPQVYARFYSSVTALKIINKLCYDAKDSGLSDRIFKAFLNSVEYLESTLK